MRATQVVISAYIGFNGNKCIYQAQGKTKPVTQVFSCLKDCTYKEGSKNMMQDKGIKLSIAQDRQRD